MGTSSSYPRSVNVTVHLDAISHNYLALRNKANSKAFAVVKADAYGHGADAVASYLSSVADGFAVVTVGEAVAVRDVGVSQPILVMQGPQDASDLDAIFEYGLWPALHDEAQIELTLAHRNALDIEPWLKVDTGMGRLGVSLASAATHLQQNLLRWRGVMSHLASADLIDRSLTQTQSTRLAELIANNDIETSLANSAGVLAWPVAKRDWARVGIGMYGCHPVAGHSDAADLLKPAMSVQAPIVSVKPIKAGATIGYAETYSCTADTLVAFVAMGYADGLPRVLDESADVLLQGVRCPIIGRVSMDSIAIDCRPLKENRQRAPRLGDLATLWGPGQPVDRLAESAGTISYELLVGVHGRRSYTD